MKRVVVIGSGIAGLRATLTLAPHAEVVLVTKTALGSGASAWAQGGIAAAVGGDDSAELHARDTLAAGAGLSDPAAVRLLTSQGPALVRELALAGARFDRDARGALALTREGAHSRPRVLHAGGDATGAELVRALTDALGPWRARGAVAVLEHTHALDLLVVAGRCAGVWVRTSAENVEPLTADATILATGGAGRVYLWTTNPREATGDGIAIAHRAGVRLAGMEFVQFHPTALACGDDPLPLLSEALRGEGAVLVDNRGARVMAGVHPLGDLAPRDIVARAIWERLQAGDTVYLDATSAPGAALPERFPAVFEACRRHGVDPRRQPVPVTPAAHYIMGGVATDLDGRTSLPGLYACGEVACTGVHGANRLASNSLLEGAVFADRAARAELAAPAPYRRHTDVPVTAAAPAEGILPGDGLVEEIRRLMWDHAGLVRRAEGLEFTVARLEELEPLAARAGGEALNLVTVARLIAVAALARRESRGSHYRSDELLAGQHSRRAG